MREDLSGMKSLKPLGKQNRELKEATLMPKGMITKGTWEKAKFKTFFKKEQSS
jgi:hypothetical protein